MILSQFLEKNYSFTLEKIYNSNNRKEKREYITELIMNLQRANINFSQRELAKCLHVSRQLINSILSMLSLKKNPVMYLFYIFIICLIKIETRGRKKFEDIYPEIVQDIEEICENTKHIDKSIKGEIIYVDVTLGMVQKKLKEEKNYNKVPCKNVISRIMKEKLGFKITKVKKDIVFKRIPETDEIFKNVFTKLKQIKESADNVIAISIDDKVAKYIGLLSAKGKSWIEKRALDHDTNPNFIAKPFGIMDLKTKIVRVFCTISNSTADFKVDCIEEYIIEKIKNNPNISKLLIFLDNGPENNSSRKLWIYRIIKLAIKYNIQIELVYYPPYHSKYNKIEHFWGVLQKHWSGMIIDSLEKLIGAINSCTWDGVPAIGYLRTKEYEKGTKVNENELNELISKYVNWDNENIKKWSLIITP